jgi:probable F420-dependent oxidoreductase
MAHPRKFRFGVQLSKAADGHDWAEQARKAEGLGYSTLFLPDHFGDQLAPMPAIMAAADATTDLKVGALVFDNDYKHPVVFAKEIATIDVLSGGRVELGLGAGWMNTDYEQSGIQHDSAKVRVDRMEEGITVMKGLFAEGPFSFEGDHYTITAHDALPKPVQKPHPPFLIGGGGKRVLSIAAREADIVGINPAIRSGNVDAESAADATAEATDRKYAWVKEAAGERFDDLEINCLCFAVIITDDPTPVHEMMAGMFAVTTDEVADVPHIMVGTVESICEQLIERRERWGMSYFVVQGGDAFDALAPIVAKLAGS